MPNEINLSNPIEMTERLMQTFKPQRFFRKMFGTVAHGTESFAIDKCTKTRLVSQFSRSDDAGKVVNRESFETDQFTPQMLKPRRNITHRDAFTRRPGEDPIVIGGPASPQERLIDLQTNDMLDLEEANERKEEKMCAEVLTTGRVVIDENGVKYTADFGMKSSHRPSLTGDNKFDGTANPFRLIDEWEELVLQDSGLGSKMIVFGKKAWAAFINNKSVLAIQDNLRINLGNVEVSTDKEFPGVKYRGHVNGYDLYTYSEFFYDESAGMNKPAMPEDRILMIAPEARMTVHYGAIYIAATKQVIQGQFFAREWTDEDKNVSWIEVDSKPLSALEQPDGVISAKVV